MTNTELLADGFIWRHAFAYADQYCGADDAAAYATFYESRVRAATELGDEYSAPDHSELFLAWARTNEIALG